MHVNLPTGYLGPISSLKNGTQAGPPHQPQVWTWGKFLKAKEFPGQELEEQVTILPVGNWVLSLMGELVSVPGRIETGLGLEKAGNPRDHPFKNVSQPQGQVTQGSLRGTGAGFGMNTPSQAQPPFPPPFQLKFRGSALALSVAPTTLAPQAA